MKRAAWIALVLAALAGCKKSSESKPAASDRPERDVPQRDFRAGPLAGTDRPEREVPPPRREVPDRDPGAGAPAEPGAGPSVPGTRQGWKQRREEFDTDGDGSLSDDERAAMRDEMRAERDARRAERMAQFDSNGDGQLDENERAAMKAERVQGMVDRLDQDGDGKLTQAELDAARAGRAGGRGGRGPGRGIDFATADSNGDGVLDADELGAAMPERRRRDGDGPPPGDTQVQ